MNKLFKSATGKTDDGFQQALFGNAYDGHVYVLTTNRLKADEVPDIMSDAATASQFVAGLLNAYFNDLDVHGIDPGLICDMGKVRNEPRPEADTNNIF